MIKLANRVSTSTEYNAVSELLARITGYNGGRRVHYIRRRDPLTTRLKKECILSGEDADIAVVMSYNSKLFTVYLNSLKLREAVKEYFDNLLDMSEVAETYQKDTPIYSKTEEVVDDGLPF